MDCGRYNRNQSSSSNYYRNNTDHNDGSSSTNDLFFKLEDYYDIPQPMYRTLSLDEICEYLKPEHYEKIVIRALLSLYQHSATNPKLFDDDEFTDRIIPLIGDLFNWTSDVEDNFIFHLNKIFDIIFQLPTTKIWDLSDKLCDYILNGLINEHSKFKILSLHILQTHIFPRRPATMNKNLYYKYLDFLSRDCIERNVNIAALYTLVNFLDVYLSDNSSEIDTEIHDSETTHSSQSPQRYPTNTKKGINALGTCCFEFFARVLDTEDFQFENHLYLVEDSLHFIIKIMKRYVIVNNIPAGQHGKTLAEKAKDAGFKDVALKNSKILHYLQELEKI